MRYKTPLTLIAILAALTSFPAFAGNNHNNDNVNGQRRPMSQGQGQRQSVRSYNDNINRNSSFSSSPNTNRSQLDTRSNASVGVVANPISTAAGGIAGIYLGSGIQVTGGDTAGSNLSSGSNITSTVYQDVKQVPMAWSPNMAMSMSPENCSNSVSFGASAGFGAISGGAPMDSDACNRRMDTRMWVVLGQMRIACERMRQDEENAEAMQLAGISCARVVDVASQSAVIKKASTLPPDDYWTKAAAVRDAQLKVISQRGN